MRWRGVGVLMGGGWREWGFDGGEAHTSPDIVLLYFTTHVQRLGNIGELSIFYCLYLLGRKMQAY